MNPVYRFNFQTEFKNDLCPENKWNFMGPRMTSICNLKNNNHNFHGAYPDTYPGANSQYVLVFWNLADILSTIKSLNSRCISAKSILMFWFPNARAFQMHESIWIRDTDWIRCYTNKIWVKSRFLQMPHIGQQIESGDCYSKLCTVFTSLASYASCHPLSPPAAHNDAT